MDVQNVNFKLLTQTPKKGTFSRKFRILEENFWTRSFSNTEGEAATHALLLSRHHWRLSIQAKTFLHGQELKTT